MAPDLVHPVGLPLQTASGPAGFLFRGFTSVRNRLLADDKFLFKVFTEVSPTHNCITASTKPAAPASAMPAPSSTPRTLCPLLSIADWRCVCQVAVDTGCATVAEVQKRGDDFWAEFELYMSDLLVGLALDVALVGMLAPVASFAVQGAPARGLTAGLSRHLAALPSR